VTNILPNGKCFGVELASPDLIHVSYHLLDFEVLNENSKVQFVVGNLDGAPEQVTYHGQGKLGDFSHKAATAGQKQICVSVISNLPAGDPQAQLATGGAAPQRMWLDIQIADEAVDYEDVANQEHLTKIELEMRKLNNHVKNVADQVSYREKRENQFMTTNASSQSRLMWWCLFEVAILVFISVVQLFGLKSMYRKKKLI
jgi:hypothetical protein